VCRAITMVIGRVFAAHILTFTARNPVVNTGKSGDNNAIMRSGSHRLIIMRIAMLVTAVALSQFVVSATVDSRGQSRTGFVSETPGGRKHPTLEDLWNGRAQFVPDIEDTGLPMGESDSLLRANGDIWSYVHASSGSGTVDSCGAPVAFPGCLVLHKSVDGGRSFRRDSNQCLIPCAQCPCSSETDHIDQQQYPRVAFDSQTALLVYEHRAHVYLRRSADGLTWGPWSEFTHTGLRNNSHFPCQPAERVGPHPFAAPYAECLKGGPPGVLISGKRSYVFVAMGQNPGHLACMSGDISANAGAYRACRAPLLRGAESYGPLDVTGPDANAYFDFRTLSSAEIQRIGNRFYMLYEGIRGPGPGDVGDNQFGLGLARSRGDVIDGTWEKFPGNPLLTGLPGNIGLGHADLLVRDGQTYLYTSLDGYRRGRWVLMYR
jgi:hypothetical protein